MTPSEQEAAVQLMRAIDAKLGRVGEEIRDLVVRMDLLKGGFDLVNRRLERFGARLEKVDARLGQIERRVS